MTKTQFLLINTVFILHFQMNGQTDPRNKFTNTRPYSEAASSSRLNPNVTHFNRPIQPSTSISKPTSHNTSSYRSSSLRQAAADPFDDFMMDRPSAFDFDDPFRSRFGRSAFGNHPRLVPGAPFFDSAISAFPDSTMLMTRDDQVS